MLQKTKMHQKIAYIADQLGAYTIWISNKKQVNRIK